MIQAGTRNEISFLASPLIKVSLGYMKYPCNRFASSKSGKIYLHTDIRMIIFRKSDLDTATEHSAPPGKGYELRSFTAGPTNPKFSPRK